MSVLPGRRIALLLGTSFLLFYGVMFYGDAVEAGGGSFADGAGHAVFFVTVSAPLLFGALVGLGYAVIGLCRFILRRPFPFANATAAYWFHLPLLYLLVAAWTQPSKDSFQRYVGIPSPGSASEIRTAFFRGFNASQYAIACRIDPQDLPELLKVREFERSAIDPNFEEYQVQSAKLALKDKGVAWPAEKFTTQYYFSRDLRDGNDFTSLVLYVTEKEDFLLIYGVN